MSTRTDKTRKGQRGLSRLRRGRATDADGPGRSIDDFVIITGFSGAGKSQAMACFEDAGYFCVDNLPPEMIGQLADLFAHEGSKVEQAAVVCDPRGGDYFEPMVEVLDDLPGIGPARKRLILKHFGSPERFLSASREELQAVPGLPGKVAREIHAQVHKAG